MNKLNIAGKNPKPIKKWTCHKFECFTEYIETYAKTLKNTECCYLELYSGGDYYTCKGTDCQIEGAQLRALKAKFAKYIFVVKNQQDEENLKQLTAPYHTEHKIEIIAGNCIREEVIRRIFDLIPRSASSFAFIDPPGFRQLRWATLKKLIAHGSDWKGHRIELLIVFPLEMALLRNLTRPECETSITRLYGNRKWQEVKQAKLDGKIELPEIRHRLVELFKVGLKNLGYKHVDDFAPSQFAKPPFYHLILASDSDSGAKILRDAWGKPRYLPCELLYRE
jgi:three-Cys-motif partner protein